MDFQGYIEVLLVVENAVTLGNQIKNSKNVFIVTKSLNSKKKKNKFRIPSIFQGFILETDRIVPGSLK